MTTVKVAPASLDPWPALERVRSAAPLVQNITNYVVMNSTANALLAVGASPAMVHAVEEVEEFVAISRALVVNIGTLSPRWVEAMRLAAARAAAAGIPWVLDPVGAGATSYRTQTAAELVGMRPAVIRGNASEIMVVAGAVGVSGKGVDSAHSTRDALAPARALAARTGALVAMTGVVDYVTDGTRAVSIANGHPMMARVTGLGCTATALVGAFLGANHDDRFTAAVSALAVLGIAGEIAAEQSPGPGSLQVHLLDALYRMDRATVTQRAHIAEAA
ncbi:MAG: hydroxyethylthiazole kinase [Gemmatimonadota bacterium]|nr:hydroxyethylthiazole kinase [Gemmatimonadota bacterium]MDE3217010.1 hydroxyethylthiazole kinase [Gemmatimonadota bacterium]